MYYSLYCSPLAHDRVTVRVYGHGYSHNSMGKGGNHKRQNAKTQKAIQLVKCIWAAWPYMAIIHACGMVWKWSPEKYTSKASLSASKKWKYTSNRSYHTHFPWYSIRIKDKNDGIISVTFNLNVLLTLNGRKNNNNRGLINGEVHSRIILMVTSYHFMTFVFMAIYWSICTSLYSKETTVNVFKEDQAPVPQKNFSSTENHFIANDQTIH